MSRSTPLSKPDLRLFLQQLQANPVNITTWPLALRVSLFRGSTIDLTIYNRRIISVPKLALMAVSPAALAVIAKTLATPAVNFTFEAPCSKTCKIPDRYLKHYEAALRAFAHWLTALCTPAPTVLAGSSSEEEVCLRFICRVLGMDSYAQHLVDRFVAQAGSQQLTPLQIHELAKSCRGRDDPLLKGLAAKIAEKKVNGNERTKKAISEFLAGRGNEVLRAGVREKEEDYGVPDRKRPQVIEIFDDKKAEGAPVEVDEDGWQIFPGVETGESPAKKRKLKHKAEGNWEIIKIN
jgi:hypothetical protein